MGTKNEGFHRISKGGDFGKSIFSGLGDVLETSFCSTTLQEVGILHTLVYFYFKGLILGGNVGLFWLIYELFKAILWLICELVW